MKQAQTRHAFPAGIVLSVVGVVCLALAISAGYTFSTLLRLRVQYLQNRGHEIAASIDAQARGPGRRNNPAFWQSLMIDAFPAYAESAAFIALVDEGGRGLASRGEGAASSAGFTRIGGREVYVFEMPVATPRLGYPSVGHWEGGWRLRIGLFTSAADSIRRQAVIELAVMLAAIMMLIVLVFALFRMLRRFVALQARESSERHLRALGTMAAALAHEIRNPLGAMKGLTQLVQEELPKEHAAQASIRTVISEAERLERLVSSLLDFARPRQPKSVDFDFARLLSEVTTMLQPRMDAAGVIVEARYHCAPPTLHSDEDGLRQVLLNTLLNAVESSPRGGSITLSVGLAGKNGDLVLELDDQGPGLGDRDPEELFQPFVTTKARGTGLGLAVSRQIAESLGGGLTLENLHRGGARCTLRIPLSRKFDFSHQKR